MSYTCFRCGGTHGWFQTCPADIEDKLKETNQRLAEQTRATERLIDSKDRVISDKEKIIARNNE